MKLLTHAERARTDMHAHTGDLLQQRVNRTHNNAVRHFASYFPHTIDCTHARAALHRRAGGLQGGELTRSSAHYLQAKTTIFCKVYHITRVAELRGDGRWTADEAMVLNVLTVRAAGTRHRIAHAHQTHCRHPLHMLTGWQSGGATAAQRGNQRGGDGWILAHG